LVRSIAERKHQEIATHTFSHFYCLEPGQTLEDFRADLSCAIRCARELGVELKSLVFPRNQFNAGYLEACRDAGLTCYRGNERSWLYAARSSSADSTLRRGARLLDSYLNISGSNTYRPAELAAAPLLDVPSSRFLRPYSGALRALEPLRYRRIAKGLDRAAENGEIYHLWWHPHNFGVHLAENLAFLERILAHAARLRESAGLESLTMGELADRLEESRWAATG
jgi:hypothetical protein